MVFTEQNVDDWNPAPQSRHHLPGVSNRKYVNWDCSLTGFEGIRAQAILPLLVENFHLDTFIAVANIIDVFVDRSYGPNFSIDKAAALAFVDRVQQPDQGAIESGGIQA